MLAVVAVDVVGVVVLVTYSVPLGIALIFLGGIITSVVLLRHQMQLARRDPGDR